MRLAICLFRHFPDSGLSRDMLRIVDAAVRRGHEVSLFTGSWEGPVPKGSELVIVPRRGLTNHARARSFSTRLRPLLETFSPDTVLGFNKIPGLDAYFAADSCFVARAVNTHASLYRLSPRFRGYSRLEKGVFTPGVSTQILSIAPREDWNYRRYYLTPDHRFRALSAGLDRLPSGRTGDTGILRQEFDLGSEHLMVLLVGSGFRTKGLDRAIRAVSALPEGLAEKTRLVVVGSGNPVPYQRQAATLGVSERLIFAGTRDDVPELMEAADLLLHPAYAELAGAVILEAIRAGLPVLVSPVCGNAWHVRESGAGHVLPGAFSQGELNKVFAEMLVSPQRQQWSDNGRAYSEITDFYSRADQAVDILEELSGTAGRDRSRGDSGENDFYVSAQLAADLDNEPGFDQLFELQGEVYREGPGRKTLRFSVSGRDYFLKRHSGVGWSEILKNLLYLRLPVTGAVNEWHATHRLRELGIDTLEPAAYGWRGRNPATRHSLIVTKALPPSISLEDYCAGWREAGTAAGDRLRIKRWLTTRLATIARTMHRGGANHRDFYLCHFHLVAPTDDTDVDLQATRLCLIDLHRMQLRRRTPSRWRVKDLAGLLFSCMDTGLTNRDFYRFVLVYSGHESMRELSASELRFWKKVTQRADRMYHKEVRSRSIARGQP